MMTWTRIEGKDGYQSSAMYNMTDAQGNFVQHEPCYLILKAKKGWRISTPFTPNKPVNLYQTTLAGAKRLTEELYDEMEAIPTDFDRAMRGC